MGALALAGAAVAPAVAAGGGLEVVSASGDYTVTAMPYTDSPSTGGWVRLHNKGTTPVRSYTLKVDYTSLTGIADVTTPFPGCKPKGPGVLLCTGKDAPAPGQTNLPGSFKVRTLKGTRAGTIGEIRVSGQAEGAEIVERVWKVEAEAGAGTLVRDRDMGTGGGSVQPGSLIRPGIGFTSFATETIKGTDIRMSAEGASFEQEFSNCKYGEKLVRLDDQVGEPSDMPGAEALCHFDDPIAAGDSVDLHPGPLRIADDHRSASWSAYVVDGREYKVTDLHTGKGPELKLVRRPADAPQGKPVISSSPITFEVDNTTDIQAIGASAEGRPGDIVTVRVGYRNNGPAGTRTWTGSEPIEDPTVETVITIPPGTTVVKVPERCWKDGSGYHGPVGRIYQCIEKKGDWWVGPGEEMARTFGLRIDDASALKPGKVSLKVLEESDSDRKNDSAAITVTLRDTPTGSMASMGARALPWIAGAAGIVAVGVAAVFAARRKRA
ncbi:MULTISPECIES: hypothetical protein [unclassified Streptomyces]|uniref:hypothetical protein n=1 Tax=unclassified Streptomyces TaxID=2593676 RepID=UPI002E28D3C1|nr:MULTISPECIES: hypothetical protein [unclassified Streptomyces]WUB89029.1 hypothetical protein OG812_21615 [Streptomyces sp. NBC_00566]